MEFKFNAKGIAKLVKWGIPIVGLLVAGPVGCIIGLVVAGCFTVSEKEEK